MAVNKTSKSGKGLRLGVVALSLSAAGVACAQPAGKKRNRDAIGANREG